MCRTEEYVFMSSTEKSYVMVVSGELVVGSKELVSSGITLTQSSDNSG
jgi:hypothetical protein